MQLKAYAKLNLILDVCGRLPDGYHEIDSVMQSVSVFDAVTVTPSQSRTVRCSVPFPDENDNIVVRAMNLFFDETGIPGGAAVEIEKQIPLLAGLGGTSADVAAVLHGLNRVFAAGLSEEKLCKIGLSVGADVPFCLTGGTKRVRGIGERLETLPELPPCAFLIVRGGEKPSTGEMFRRLDALPAAHPEVKKAVAALKRGDLAGFAALTDNSFARLYDLKKIQSEIGKCQPLGGTLSGSGPSVFAVFDRTERANAACEALKGAGFDALTAIPVKKGVE